MPSLRLRVPMRCVSPQLSSAWLSVVWAANMSPQPYPVHFASLPSSPSWKPGSTWDGFRCPILLSG